MGLTYFKRFRMDCPLDGSTASGLGITSPSVPDGYDFVPYSDGLLPEHARAKYESFRFELDANVFPCLGRQDGCLHLMREITSRHAFVSAATWLCRYTDQDQGFCEPVGTIQGLQIDGWGAIQNVGIVPEHRNRGLGAILLAKAALGFASVGLRSMHLEVTTDNTAAIRFYQRLGFKRAEVVYKAAEIAGA